MIKSDSFRVIRMVQHMQSINVIHHINKSKGKSHNHFSGCKKKIDKIQHPFIIKALIQVGVERKKINIIKAIYSKSTANIILKGEKLKAFW